MPNLGEVINKYRVFNGECQHWRVKAPRHFWERIKRGDGQGGIHDLGRNWQKAWAKVVEQSPRAILSRVKMPTPQV